MCRSSFLVLICLSGQTCGQSWDNLHGKPPSRRPVYNTKYEESKQKEMLMVSAADLIHGTNPMVWRTLEIRMRSDQCAAFEIGFVFRSMEESFKKMLDLYKTAIEVRKNISEPGLTGHLMYLQKVEKFHWDIYHLHNMMHEIENKYKMDAHVNASGMWEGGKRWYISTTRRKGTWTYTWPKRTTSWWRPLEYGWNNDYYEWK